LGTVVTNFNTAPYNWWVLLFSKIAGTVICGALLIQFFDKNNPLFTKICKFGSQVDCNSILNSSAAKLWGWLSWSELGFIYFSGGFIALLISNFDIQTLGIFVLINILTLPFTFYSLYYQFFVVKKICTFCISILILFWIEFICLLPFWSDVSIQFLTIYPIAIGYSLPLLSWIVVKPLAYKALQAKQIKVEISKFKRNPDVFQTILLKQPMMPPIRDSMSAIILGNLDAVHTITIITNPVCGPCAEAHRTLEMLLEENAELKVQFIFAVGTDDSATAHKVAQYFLFAYLNDLPVQKIMHSWFTNENSSYEDWIKQYQQNTSSNVESQTLKMHKVWCEEAFVDGTPTFYIDSYQQPTLYTLEDLALILPLLKTTKEMPT